MIENTVICRTRCAVLEPRSAWKNGKAHCLHDPDKPVDIIVRAKTGCPRFYFTHPPQPIPEDHDVNQERKRRSCCDPPKAE